MVYDHYEFHPNRSSRQLINIHMTNSSSLSPASASVACGITRSLTSRLARHGRPQPSPCRRVARLYAFIFLIGPPQGASGVYSGLGEQNILKTILQRGWLWMSIIRKISSGLDIDTKIFIYAFVSVNQSTPNKQKNKYSCLRGRGRGTSSAPNWTRVWPSVFPTKTMAFSNFLSIRIVAFQNGAPCYGGAGFIEVVLCSM